MKANAVSNFEALHQAIEKDVSLFNKHFSGAMQKLEIRPVGQNRFQVLRPYSPDFLLDIGLQPDLGIIKWEIKTQGQSFNHGTVESKYDSTSGVSMIFNGVPISFEEVSKKLIEPAIRGLV